MRTLLLFLIASIFLAAPASSHAQEGQALKIISLSPATTEILFALGLDKEIIGVSTFCNYPAQAKSKEKVGTFSQANIEKILSMKPDIIFCTGLEQAPTVTKLRQLGLNICVSDPTTVRELFASILEIGRLTKKEESAQELVAGMQASLKEIEEDVRATADKKKPKVFVEFWHDPLMSAGQGSFIDEIISLAGGINIAHNMPRPFGNFSSEQVLKHDPDIIILGYMTPQLPESFLERRLGWKNLRAVRSKQVYSDIDPDIILRPSPRLIEGLKEIRKKLIMAYEKVR